MNRVFRRLSTYTGTVTGITRVGPVLRARLQDASGRSEEVYALHDSIAGRRLEHAKGQAVSVKTTRRQDQREWVQFVHEVFTW